jgi:hypothetical protein
MCCDVRKVIWACLGAWLVQGAVLAEPLTNLAIRLEQPPHVVKVSWLSSAASSVYTVQWTDVLPPTRWRASPPWNQWPISGLEHTELIRANQPRFFRVEAVQRGRVLTQIKFS